MSRTLVIADPGCTHEGSLPAMLALVDLAAAAGADVYKGQWVSDPAALVARRRAPEFRTYYDWLAYPAEWHAVLRERCDQLRIQYAVTVYLPQDVPTIDPYVSWFKVASFESGAIDLLNAYATASKEKAIIVSCGMGAVVDRAQFFPRQTKLLLCVSAYPTPLDQLHLAGIRALNLDGLSDHTAPDCVYSGALAVAAGATIVERHIRLETTPQSNPDAVVAMDAAGFAEYVRLIRQAEMIVGYQIVAGIRPAEESMLRYRARSIGPWPVSRDYYSVAAPIPGRSLTRSKAPGRLFEIGSGPLYATSGAGAVLRDADGFEYIDMICGLGAISLGYDGPRAGGVYSLPHTLEADAAQIVLSSVAPWASSVRFVKTGSEATHAAYRIAKAATGRKHVLVGDWCYAGWHEWCADKEFPFTHRYAHGAVDLGAESSDGEVGSDFDRCLPSEVAAVFVEPHRWEPVSATWLRWLRAWCSRLGALLVFDEMIYGGRWALGGATEYFSVKPDLACFGKAFGNGTAVAFVVGGQELAAHGEMISGTYSGETSGLEAVVRVVSAYTSRPVIETLWARGRQLQAGLIAAVEASGVEAYPEGAPVHQRLRFADPTHGRRFAASMARQGVLWHPDVVNVMEAHTEAQIAEVISAAAVSLSELSCAY